MNTALAAVAAISLMELSNTELASANLAVSGLGGVNKIVLCFNKLLELSLIDAEGKPSDKESLEYALAFEVNRRVENGSFN